MTTFVKLNDVPADKLHLFSPRNSPLKRLEREVERLTKRSAQLAERQASLPPGSSRARVTSANAKRARVAEARDRAERDIAALRGGE